MQTFSLRSNLVVVIDGVTFSLRKRLVDNRLLFIDELGEPMKVSEQEFYARHERGEIEISADQPFLGEVPKIKNVAPDLTCFPASHRQEAIRRRKFLIEIMEGTERLPCNRDLLTKITAAAEKLGDAHIPSASTIRRWYARFNTNNSVKLIPRHADKGRKKVISGVLEDELQCVISEIYLQLERPKISLVIGIFINRVDSLNATRLPSQRLKKPSPMSIRRYIESLDPFEVDVHRIGKYAAKKKHRVASDLLTVGFNLERWEIDHTLLDVLLVDDETGLVIGRPYITVVLDRYSRMVMGFLVHLAAPNTETVLRVIERSIRPKAAFLERFPKLRNEWRAHGMPARLVPDNAAEFHAGDLVDGFNDLGIEIMYPRSRGPEMKGAVERFFRTLNTGLVHNLPGTTFSNTYEKGDYKPESHACFTLYAIEAMIVKWIVDGYQVTPHRGLNNKTPSQVWRDGERRRPIVLPADADELECILARRKKVKVHHYGIQLDKQFYHSPELAEIKMRMGSSEEIEVRYRDEMGHVWVHDRFRNLFLQVPIKDKALIGVSRDMYNASQKALRDRGSSNPTHEQIYQHYRDQADDIGKARHSQKMRLRRTAARAKLDKEGKKVETQLGAKSGPLFDFPGGPLTIENPSPYKVIDRRPKEGK